MSTSEVRERTVHTAAVDLSGGRRLTLTLDGEMLEVATGWHSGGIDRRLTLPAHVLGDLRAALEALEEAARR
jgi:hypothetical protein